MAIVDLDYRFKPRAPSNKDESLESLIEKAGRAKVLAAAKALGWGAESPPKWVWQQIAADIIAGRSAV